MRACLVGSPTSLAMPASRFLFAVPALVVTQIIGWGTSFNLPAVTGTAMAADLGVPLAGIMFGPTIMLVLMALVALPMASLFERFGARAVMTVGSALAALGVALMATATNVPVYYAAWVALGFSGAATLTTAAQIALAEISGADARRGIGALMIFGGVGLAIWWPIVGAIQDAFGWRWAAGFGCLMTLAVCVPLHWLTLSRRGGITAAAERPAARTRVDMLSFALLALTMAANGFVTWGLSLTIIVLFQELGIDHGTAVLTASFVGITQLGARLIDFLGRGHWSALTTGVVACAALPASYLILLWGHGLTAAIAFVVVYGAAGGAVAVARATIPLHLFAPEAYARASSMLALPLNLAFAGAPPAFAAILTGWGSATALVIATVLSGMALLSIAALAARHRLLRSAPVAPARELL